MAANPAAIVVINKVEHQLPLFIVTFNNPHAAAMAAQTAAHAARMTAYNTPQAQAQRRAQQAAAMAAQTAAHAARMAAYNTPQAQAQRAAVRAQQLHQQQQAIAFRKQTARQLIVLAVWPQPPPPPMMIDIVKMKHHMQHTFSTMDVITIAADKANQHDPYALQILVQGVGFVGYVSRTQSETLHNVIDLVQNVQFVNMRSKNCGTLKVLF